MDRSDSNFIHSLLAKNISFCLYRFPFENEVCLALEEKFLPHKPGKSFWIAPFVKSSVAKDIFFYCVNQETSNDKIIQKIISLPDASVQWQELPEDTNREAYFQKMNLFLKAIREGKIQKAILSRVRKVDKPEGFDPLQSFKELCSRFPKAFVHFMYHKEGGMWLGATPELLLSYERNCYTTMAVAGTQPTNEAHHYFWKAKEKDEHHLVEKHIESVFAKHQNILKFKNGPKTVEAGKVAHLRTTYEFNGNNHSDLKELLNDLHPTPAVGGLPVAEGIDFILQNEGYDREYYSGFLGEIDFVNNLRLYTNLRCMQIGKKDIAVYIGGGITADSDPESEWEETVLKSHTMLDTLKDQNKNEAVR